MDIECSTCGLSWPFPLLFTDGIFDAGRRYHGIPVEFFCIQIHLFAQSPIRIVWIRREIHLLDSDSRYWTDSGEVKSSKSGDIKNHEPDHV